MFLYSILCLNQDIRSDSLSKISFLKSRLLLNQLTDEDKFLFLQHWCSKGTKSMHCLPKLLWRTEQWRVSFSTCWEALIITTSWDKLFPFYIWQWLFPKSDHLIFPFNIYSVIKWNIFLIFTRKTRVLFENLQMLKMLATSKAWVLPSEEQAWGNVQGIYLFSTLLTSEVVKFSHVHFFFLVVGEASFGCWWINSQALRYSEVFNFNVYNKQNQAHCL